MTHDSAQLQQLISEMAAIIEQKADPEPKLYHLFFQQPELSFNLIDIIQNLKEELGDDLSVYSASVFALDVCVVQLQIASDSGNKISNKMLYQLMDYLAKIINTQKHSLSFWLPVLNSFYEAHVELSEDLKNAYFDLANNEEPMVFENDQLSHLNAIRELIHELSDLSVFEIAENFFAQSYAMPSDFFTDLVLDLYSIDEGADIGLFTLLHPKAEVREVAIATLNEIINKVTFSSASLSRLRTIMYWYPKSYHDLFSSWIKIQRKKGVVFAQESEPASHIDIKATEVDGTGAQGMFITVRNYRKNRLCGLLLKYNVGIKDVWVTPELSSREVTDYYSKAFDENVTLRSVDLSYFIMMVEHFLAVSMKQNEIPPVHFLEIQELLGVRLRPHKLDLNHLMEQFSVQILHFTQEVISESLQRSKMWLKRKSFTESWYLEDPLIDKIVNHNSSFVNGVRICRLKEAMNALFTNQMELDRDKWQFHFLWVALWARSKERLNEKVWHDSFLIAYVIHQGRPLNEIPIMQEICQQTVINSIETMQERKTHLNQE
jgi:hypothetical protein